MFILELHFSANFTKLVGNNLKLVVRCICEVFDKHYAEVERFLLSLVRSVIHIGKKLMGADIAENAEIDIDFDRSVIIDDTAERLQDLQEVRDGVKAPWEFRAKYYGDTEEDAKKILDEIKGVENVDLGFEDGDG